MKAEGLYRKHHTLNQDERSLRSDDGKRVNKSLSPIKLLLVGTGTDNRPSHSSREEEGDRDGDGDGDGDQDAFFYFNRFGKHRSRSTSSSCGADDSISEDEHYMNQYVISVPCHVWL